MDLAAVLEQFKPEPALSEWLGKLLEKTQNDALKIQQADLQIQQAALKTQHDALKIQALTFELAYYKRIRFANKSEAFTFDQRLISAICSMRVGPPTPARWKPKLNNRVQRRSQLNANALAASPYPSTCRASSIAMNWNPAPVVSADRTWSRSARVSANNSMSNPPNSSSIATSVRSTPAGLARQYQPHRFRPPSSTAAWPRRACSPG